jgi:hypothetical protein
MRSDPIVCSTLLLAKHRIEYLLKEVDVVQGAMDELRAAPGEGEVLPAHLHPVLVTLHLHQLRVRHVAVPYLHVRVVATTRHDTRVSNAS